MERREPFDDAFLSRFGQRRELSFSRWGEENGIGHWEELETKVFQYHIEGLRPLFLCLNQSGTCIDEVNPIF